MTKNAAPASNAPLDALIAQDDAHHIEIAFDRGRPVLVATVDEDGDEICAYEDDDLTAELAAAARTVPVPARGAAHYEPATGDARSAPAAADAPGGPDPSGHHCAGHSPT